MREIQAAVIERAGVAPVIETLRLDEPHAGEVLVRMTASGVCHSDLHVRDGEWPRPGPIVMGHEGAGVIEAVGVPGMRAVARRAAGGAQLVRAVPRCRECQRGRQWLCRTRRRSTTRGGRDDPHDPRRTARRSSPTAGSGRWRPAQVVPVTSVVPMPEGVPARGRGAHRLRRVDRRRGRDQDRGGASGFDRGDHRPRRRRPVVRHGRRARERLADRRRGHEPGEAGPRARAGRHGDGARGPGRPGRHGRGDQARRPATVARTSRSRRSGCPHDGPGGRVPATRRHRGPRRHAAVRRAGVVRGLPVRRRGAPDPRVQLRVGGTPRWTSRSYAEWYLHGQLPVDRLIDRRLPLSDLDDAFDRLRAGQAARQVVVFADAASG